MKRSKTCTARSRKAIPFHILLQLAQQFTQHNPPPTKKRGRPPRYPESLILALLVAQQQRTASLRSLLAWARNEGQVEAPTLATLHYRFAHIEESRLQAFNQWSAQQIIGTERVQTVLVDGTGWDYSLPIELRWCRGTPLRGCRSHVKGVVVVGLVGDKRVVLWARLGEAFADERRFVLSGLHSPEASALGSGVYFVGDKLYGMSRAVLGRVRSLGWIGVVRVEASLWRGVSSGLRLWAQEQYPRFREVYGRRSLVESLIGSVKGRGGGVLRCRRERMARRCVWGQLLLWNVGMVVCFLCVVCALGAGVWVAGGHQEISRTPSFSLDILRHIHYSCNSFGKNRRAKISLGVSWFGSESCIPE